VLIGILSAGCSQAPDPTETAAPPPKANAQPLPPVTGRSAKLVMPTLQGDTRHRPGT